jgi:hypothetical protein
MSNRPAIPKSVQQKLLLANRHACCVCQKARVQIHNIDGNPSNNDVANLAALCTDHHDLATMQLGLTKKLTPEEVKEHKRTWEAQCQADILALARDRINFYATLYKNPPRIRQSFLALSEEERRLAVKRAAEAIVGEHPDKSSDAGFDWQAVPGINDHTRKCLESAAKGELWPSWLPRVRGHPDDSDYPVDMSPPHGMAAFHLFDLYCQVLVRILMAARSVIPLEDLYEFESVDDLNAFQGRLVVWRSRIYGKGVKPLSHYKEHPTSRIQIRAKVGELVVRTTMGLRNMYVFSDTSAMNLINGSACGVGIFGGAFVDDTKPTERQLTLIPLIVGFGGFSMSTNGRWDVR